VAHHLLDLRGSATVTWELQLVKQQEKSERDSPVSIPLPALLINLRHMRQVNWARLGAAGSLAISRIDQR
jgi:hypothetical protein